jgi:hypothetical protein
MHASSWKFVYVRNTARTAVFYKIRMKSKGTRMTQTAYGKLLDIVFLFETQQNSLIVKNHLLSLKNPMNFLDLSA